MGAGDRDYCPPEEDTFKFLVSTDNHLGYMENDPERGDDSFNTFEEVLQTAIEHKVDFILLGGDLFHFNKPSRRCMYKCMSLLRKHCMGDRACSFQLISDPQVNFGHNAFPGVNYMDPNLNISMPVFSINGNHDDPTGSDNLCALDMLSAAGVINYFGKIDRLDEINVHPVILKKGKSKLCLYGLSAVRDERLHRMFRNDKVHLICPDESREPPQEGEARGEAKPDWFHLLVLHQNHVTHSPTNHIPESFLSDHLDLVIWGHEHEAKDVQQNSQQNFHVLQPGSSVATSLSQGEQPPKNSWIISVSGNRFKAEKVPLQTVRPFIFRDLNLADSGIDPKHPKSKDKMNIFLTRTVKDMLNDAKKLHSKHPMQPRDKPLMRLRVDYSGFEPCNAAMFAKQFHDSIANKDILHLHRKTETDELQKRKMLRSLGTDMTEALLKNGQLAANQLQTTVIDLVKDFFHSADQSNQMYKLSVLSETGLSYAVGEYVEKDEQDAVPALVGHQVNKTIDWTNENCKKELDEDVKVEDEIVKLKAERAAKHSTSAIANSTILGNNIANWSGSLDELEETKLALSSIKRMNSTTISEANGGAGNVLSDNEDEFGVDTSRVNTSSSSRVNLTAASGTSKRGGTSTRGRGRGAGRGARGASTATASKIQTTLADMSKIGCENDSISGRTKRGAAAVANHVSDDENDDDDLPPTLNLTSSSRSQTRPLATQRDEHPGRSSRFGREHDLNDGDSEQLFASRLSSSKRSSSSLFSDNSTSSKRSRRF